MRSPVLAVAAVALAAACSSSEPAAPTAASPAPSSSPTPAISSSPSPTPSATPSAAATALRPTDVTFVSARHGWVVERGHLETTTDAGQTWTALPPAPAPVTQVRFASDLIGYAWVAEGPLWVTRDGGLSWRDGRLAHVQQLEVAAGTAWALAGPSPYPGVWRAAVGADRFERLGMTPNRSGSLTVHGDTAYIVGDQGAGPIAGSIDVRHGTGVRNVPLPCRGPQVYVPFARLGVATDGRVLLACIPDTATQPLRAYLSGDEARTWTATAPPPEAPAGVTAIRKELFAWGRDVQMQESGRWSTVLAGPSKGFALVGFQDDTHGVALGRNGALHLTSDGGRTWTTAAL